MRTIIIGSRGSTLALCQAQILQTLLIERFPGKVFELKTVKSLADKKPKLSLADIPGEGIFVKELERSLVDSQIDIAVHSLKDMPLEKPEQLIIAAILERKEPRDAFVSASHKSLIALPAGASIGTASPRRRSQLLFHHKALSIKEIRGNVDTRLRKLRAGEYDAVVVAASGMIRLGLKDTINEYIELSEMLPAPGQGALAIESRVDDDEVRSILSPLDHLETRACVETERAFLQALGGGCHVPIAAYASMDKSEIILEGAVLAVNGSAQIRDSTSGPMTEPITIAHRLAHRLIAKGAKKLLEG